MGLVATAPAQNTLPLENRPELIRFNLSSTNGVPLSNIRNNPPGSDGRGPAAPGVSASNLFKSFLAFGGGVVTTNNPANPWTNTLSFAANAANSGLPRAENGSGTMILVLKQARVGGTYLGQAQTYLFGQTIPVPATTELGGTNFPAAGAARAEDYWQAEPHSANDHAGARYYWSPNSRQVYAVQPGQVSITWKRVVPTNNIPTLTNNVGYVLEGGNYYALFTNTYLVSGSAVKAPRKMHWTEGVFRSTGKAIAVPSAAIGGVAIVYNSTVPERVAHEYVAPDQVPIVETNRLEETRTFWYDRGQGLIFAYNAEGRVFMELLGDVRASDNQRNSLGFEIVDISREPARNDVTIELGEKLTAFQNGGDDSGLFPEAVLQGAGGAQFAYRHVRAGIERPDFYAEQETRNLNDLLMHWLETGVQGLRWPSRFVRYALVWPADAAAYSHYLRPQVATELEAKETAAPLPTENVPAIAYQDPLDRPRARLTESFAFYTWLESPPVPAHRALLRFTSGEHVRHERVFSWRGPDLVAATNSAATNFLGSVATRLSAWNTNTTNFSFSGVLTAPRVVSQTVEVGQRIHAPAGEAGASGSNYLAGYIVPSQGSSYHGAAYVNPFASGGFAAANGGAIIPVNAIPGTNTLEVWWFRETPEDFARGFKAVRWPAALGRYTIQWPAAPREIILAGNDGSGGLGSLEATGFIYTQNNPALPGYNPNEEHALMLGGQAYALRDDLNNTNAGGGYSSHPFVLLSFTDADGRPSVTPFRVRREKPEEGISFDYVVRAGTALEAPMPLPFLPAPVSGRRNYNTEPPAVGGDLPAGWSEVAHANGPYGHYGAFTYRDRKENFWVYRGLHAGVPALAAGTYSTNTGAFGPMPDAVAVVGEPFTNFLHVSRLEEALTLALLSNSPPLPAGLGLNGVTITGTPTAPQTNTVQLLLTDAGDGSQVTNTLTIRVVGAGAGSVVAQQPLVLISTNRYGGNMVRHSRRFRPTSTGTLQLVDRPPFLAQSPGGSNSFTMQFYYKTQAGFAFPGQATPPVGTVVPYLRAPGSTSDGASRNTPALDIVYRPVWPARPGTVQHGETVTKATTASGFAVRGQSSLKLLYQQSIAADINAARPSALLHDSTREKSSDLQAHGLEALPAGVKTDAYQGRVYFPNLPPHLAERLYFDPNLGARGAVVLKGEFREETAGASYLLLNVLRGSDLAAALALCPANDGNKARWDSVIAGLQTAVETFRESATVPGTYVADATLTTNVGVGDLVEVKDDDTAVDSYALSAGGPGSGFITLIAGNGLAFQEEGEPVAMKVLRVTGTNFTGEIKVLPSANPLNELVTFQHTLDLAGRFSEFEYDWRIAPPVDGLAPANIPGDYQPLVTGTDRPRHTLGGSGIQALVDNWVIVRYRPVNPNHPLYDQWSAWTRPALAEGWIKRVLAGLNPFNQRTGDLFNNAVNTDVSLLTQAGRRWEGDIALNADTINNYGLIEIYETVLRRGRSLSIDAGINFGPANDALLLAAGYLNDLYMMIGNEAWADAANPTIGIGTADQELGDVATALFSFKGQTPTLLEEELALLRGRDDFLQPGVEVSPAYNRLFWNYTRGIDAGEVVYALNYNIQENPNATPDGRVDAEDAARMFPQGHGDAYGHYLTALKGYFSLLINDDFDWVPRIEAVTVLGVPVAVDYFDERKFAAAAVAAARAGQQITDLTWRKDYRSGQAAGWEHFGATRVNATRGTERHWSVDHWASRTAQGAYLNWVAGNAILPPVDPDPGHEGIQKVDRTTVPELQELPAIAKAVQASLDNAEAHLTPLGLPEDSIAFDINPSQVVDSEGQTHFEQIYARAVGALRNAVTSFDDAKDVSRLMRSEENTLADFQLQVALQELAFTNQLIELYGRPYPQDVGPGRTFPSGYAGPDLIHYTYVETPDLDFMGRIPLRSNRTIRLEVNRELAENTPPSSLWVALRTAFGFSLTPDANPYRADLTHVDFNVGPHGFFNKPPAWTGQRPSPGKIQQAISELIAAQHALAESLAVAEANQADMDRSLNLLNSRIDTYNRVRDVEEDLLVVRQYYESTLFVTDTLRHGLNSYRQLLADNAEAAAAFLPDSFIAGLAAGGDVMSPAEGAIRLASGIAQGLVGVLEFDAYFVARGLQLVAETDERWIPFTEIEPLLFSHELKQSLAAMDAAVDAQRLHLYTINQRLREVDDARRELTALQAQGDRMLKEREIHRRRAAAVIQGYRTRDAGFRAFRNEKLERYKTLFDLAARYAFLAVNAYDYETGLLNSSQGRDFRARVIAARALGVMEDGEPQFAGSNTGDPGLSSALAEMKADWEVIRGRLGFNNPDGYSTTASLRTEKLRILPGTDGDTNWRDMLAQARVSNILDDPDVRRYCMQIDDGSGLAVPGLVIDFSTVIGNGLNLFGRDLAGGDHAFNPASFATKIFGVGIALEGYVGMDDPDANAGAVGGAGGQSPPDPGAGFLDPLALSATPYVYLIPVGVDSMRSTPLGDSADVRSWTVNDVTIPLPFNIGGTTLDAQPYFLSGNSLSEPLFAVRKHQSFRPVSSASLFSTDIFTETGGLSLSQFTNRRLIGRSAWNTQWKLVIPGRTLLANPDEGLDRFLQTVRDIKIHFVTYSYSGN